MLYWKPKLPAATATAAAARQSDCELILHLELYFKYILHRLFSFPSSASSSRALLYNPSFYKSLIQPYH